MGLVKRKRKSGGASWEEGSKKQQSKSRRPRRYANSSKITEHRSIPSLRTTPNDMARPIEYYYSYWEADVLDEFASAFFREMASRPRREGTGATRAKEIIKQLYPNVEQGFANTLWNTLRKRVAVIVDSFLYTRFGDNAYTGNIRGRLYSEISNDDKVRIARAIYEIPEYSIYVPKDAPDPYYLSGYLWDNRILWIVEKADTAKKQNRLPPVSSLLGSEESHRLNRSSD